MKGLRICLLGDFIASTQHGSLELGKSEAHLLAYLALSSGRLVPRLKVAEAIWVDYPEKRARANLSTAIWRLRAVASEHGCTFDIVLVRGDFLGIRADLCEVDVDEFRRCTFGFPTPVLGLDALARAAHALDLYKGDLLSNWDSEWFLVEREGLRQRYQQTLRILSEAFEQRGRYDLAIQYARRAAESDPFDETSQRSLIRLLSLTGERASAVAQFVRFARLARSELGIEPDKETFDLVGDIRKTRDERDNCDLASPTLIPIQSERVPLVGRREERRVLACYLDAAVRGSGAGVLITGDAGVGKSKLVHWVMEEWAARGGVLGQGRCAEFNEPVPYQSLLDALGSIVDSEDLSEFVRLGGDALRNGPSDDAARGMASEYSGSDSLLSAGKLRLFSWLKSRLRAASLKRPLLVVVEDIQWADAGTLDFLTYLLGHTRSLRLVVTVTSRPFGDARHAAVIEMLSRCCAAALHLSPLAKDETAELVRVLLDQRRLASKLTEWIYDETEGNPLFVIETLRLLQQRREAGLGDVTLRKDRMAPDLRSPVRCIPEGVRLAVAYRLNLLEPAFLRVAQIASVLGRSFDEELLETVSGTRGNRLARVISALLRAGVFEREGAGYRFTHDKIRAVCYENLAASVRRACHMRAAAALATMGEIPVHRLAWHQFSAGLWSLATTSWELAGDRSKDLHAYEEALSAYRYAMSCLKKDTATASGDVARREAKLLLRIEEVLANQGRLQERREVLDRLGILCHQDPRLNLSAVWLSRRALCEEHIGNFGTAALLARRAWSFACRAGELEQEVEALRILAWSLNRAGRHERSVLVSRLALKKAQNSRFPSLVAILWQAAAGYLKLSRYSAAASHLERAESMAIKLGLRGELVHIPAMRGVLDKWTGRVYAARAGLLRALQLASEAYDPLGIARATFHLATLDALEGRLDDSLRRLRAAITLSRSIRHTRTHLACLNHIAYGVGRLLGNYEWAWKASAHALLLAEASGSRLLSAMCKDSQAMLLLEQGLVDESMILINQVLRLLEGGRGSIGPNQESVARKGVIWLHLGDLEEAQTNLELARRVQTQMGDRLVLVDTLTHLALVYAKRRDADRAISTSEEAVSLIAEVGYANMQPQRIFWHHYQILEIFGREPRFQYLQRAVELIESQASRLSKVQRVRFKRDVALNRAILEAWQQRKCQPTSEPGVSNLPREPMVHPGVGTIEARGQEIGSRQQ